MNFYQLNKTLGSISQVVREQADDSFFDHKDLPPKECKSRMANKVHPLDQYKNIEDDIRKLGVTIPSWNDFKVESDCEGWLPVNRLAATYMLAVQKVIIMKNRPEEQNVSYDSDKVRKENYSPWSAIYSQIYRFLDRDREGYSWWQTYPEQANAAISVAMRDVAEHFLQLAKEGALGNNYKKVKIDGHDLVVVNPEIIKLMFKYLRQRMPAARVFTDIYGESLEPLKESVDKQSELAELIARHAYIRMPQIFKKYGDEYVMSVIDDVTEFYSDWPDDQGISSSDITSMLDSVVDKLELESDDNNESLALEGAATVFSDAKGHHLKNADGEVVQTFDKTANGLRQARNALYANYNVLSMEKPKESTMNEFEDKFNNALNESMTVTTTAGTDAPDTVNVNATDEDAHTLVAILKAAGLPYKDQEAKIVAATPCGEQVEEEYANEPDEKTMSTDFMVNKLAGGLNRQKQQFKKEYPGDNPMAVNEENLMRGLWDLYKKV